MAWRHVINIDGLLISAVAQYLVDVIKLHRLSCERLWEDFEEDHPCTQEFCEVVVALDENFLAKNNSSVGLPLCDDEV